MNSEWKEEAWRNRWKESKLRWHKSVVNPFLERHVEIFEKHLASSSTSTAREDCPKRRTIFIPLSGKTLDIPFLLEKGFKVFCVEGVQQAIEELCQENDFNLQYDTATRVYSNESKTLSIYFGNIFECPIENWGPFDCVWDRGSITAIDECLRDNYASVMLRSLRNANGDIHQFAYLLVVFDYEKQKTKGIGPKCLTLADITDIYGSWSKVTLIDTRALPPDHIIKVQMGPDTPAYEKLYLLTNLQSRNNT